MTDLSNHFVKTTRKNHLTRQLFGNLILGMIQLNYYVPCKKKNKKILIYPGPGVHYPDFS